MVSRPGDEFTSSSEVHRLVRGVVRAVEELTGRPSRWNGRVAEERSPGVTGSAHADGLITADPKLVTMVGRPTSEVPPRELIHLREGVTMLAHEVSHLISEDGDLERPDAGPVADRAATALDEGLAENWAHSVARSVVLSTGLNDRFPELDDVGCRELYPGYAPAVAALANGLSAESGQDTDDVTQDLMLTDRSQRWNAAADIMMNARLRDVVPPEHADHVRALLADDLHAQFMQLDNAEHYAESLRQETSQDIGRESVERLGQIADSVRAHYEAHGDAPEAGFPSSPFPEYITAPEVRAQRGAGAAERLREGDRRGSVPIADQSRFPPPDPSTRVHLPGSGEREPEIPTGAGDSPRRVLSGQAAAGGATARTPSAATVARPWQHVPRRGPGTRER